MLCKPTQFAHTGQQITDLFSSIARLLHRKLPTTAISKTLAVRVNKLYLDHSNKK